MTLAMVSFPGVREYRLGVAYATSLHPTIGGAWLDETTWTIGMSVAMPFFENVSFDDDRPSKRR